MSEKEKRQILVASRDIFEKAESHYQDVLYDASSPTVCNTVKQVIGVVRTMMRNPKTAEILISITPAGEGEGDEDR